MQNRHSFSRATLTVAVGLIALIATAAASAAVTADPVPAAQQINWQAINEAAAQQVTFN